MRFRYRAWWLTAILAVIAALVVTGIRRYRYRFVRSDPELLRLLPRRTDASVFFADVGTLRQAGFLNLLEEGKPTQEQQYTQFVRETGFDYTQNLNAAAGEMAEGQFWLALRGHFRWKKIRDYAASQGGSCRGDLCVTGTSNPGAAVAFREIQPDVMALAIAGDSAAAEQIRPGQDPRPFVFDAPIWVRPSRALLANPASLPVPLRIFAISLQSADYVVLALRGSEAEHASFAIAIEALFRNEPTAETAKNQLEIDTRMLKIELMRERRQPDPGDLSWLLTSGIFQVFERRLIGAWPVRKELIHSLQ